VAAGRVLTGALLALALAAPSAFAASAPSARAPAGEMLIVEGAGDGHGVGMSQDGALGLAEHGYSDAQILAHYYTGTAIGQAPAGYIVRVLVGSKVLALPLEQYVRGVVAAEMPSSWPAAALQAQAIASRTYALTSDAGGSKFDVYSDTRSQVYGGAAAETPQSNAAVAATAGQIVTYDGAPAATYFFASSGGMTENIENSFIGAAAEPWLKGVADPYETSASDWRVSIGMSAAAKRLGGLVDGSLLGIEVLKRGVSPRIVSAELLGSAGDTLISGPELEYRLGLASAWAYFSLQNGSAVTREPDASSAAQRAAPALGKASSRAAARKTRPAIHALAPVMDAERGGTVGPEGQDQQLARSGGVAAG
jgi:SpoIID/LytB domain protein